MDTYEWQKNHAIVLRLYYTERILETTCFFGLAYSMTNALYVQKGYMSKSMRGVMQKRILAPWPYILGINGVLGFILLKPLHWDEIKPQLDKRKSLVLNTLQAPKFPRHSTSHGERDGC